MIWTVSIHRLYKMDNSDEFFVMGWGIVTLVCDVVLQFQLFGHYDYFNEKEGNPFKYIKSFWRDLLLMGYFATLPLHYSNY